MSLAKGLMLYGLGSVGAGGAGCVPLFVWVRLGRVCAGLHFVQKPYSIWVCAGCAGCDGLCSTLVIQVIFPPVKAGRPRMRRGTIPAAQEGDMDPHILHTLSN